MLYYLDRLWLSLGYRQLSEQLHLSLRHRSGCRYRPQKGAGDSEYELIRYPQRGVCLYKCGTERYLLEVHAPHYKEKLFGKAGGR